MSGQWPASLWLVRHGESSGNVARDLAEADGLHVIDIAHRDMDVPLSPLGEHQARLLGERLRRETFDTVLTSPYVRAEQTARLALGDVCDVVLDERLREREFGILDRLTKTGITAQFPEQAAARAFLGKFWHRPPGGESWADVALRLRSFVDTLGRQHAGERVVVVAHQVVILVFRYLLEQLREREILDIDRSAEVANCSVTVYEADGDDLVLRCFNDVDHLDVVTAEPDRPVLPR